jgi:GrpB-like predicted nucleotidyltransferase (UPF0157 family)
VSFLVAIVDYDPGWPGLFKREAGRIRSALGELALCIEHAGSTSVPGLSAKPVIDIVLAVADSSKEPEYAPLLERAGYRLHVREPNWHEHRLFKGPDTDINLHVFSEGCPEINRMLAFRDRLRNDENDRNLYSLTKRELAQREWADVHDYADAKTAVVEMIIARSQSSEG